MRCNCNGNSTTWRRAAPPPPPKSPRQDARRLAAESRAKGLGEWDDSTRLAATAGLQQHAKGERGARWPMTGRPRHRPPPPAVARPTPPGHADAAARRARAVAIIKNHHWRRPIPRPEHSGRSLLPVEYLGCRESAAACRWPGGVLLPGAKEDERKRGREEERKGERLSSPSGSACWVRVNRLPEQRPEGYSATTLTDDPAPMISLRGGPGVMNCLSDPVHESSTATHTQQGKAGRQEGR